MKSQVLAIPLLFTTLAACTAAPSADEPSASEAEELINGGGGPNLDAEVIVPDYCEGATGSITASSTALAFGGSTTLQWSVQRPAGCTAMPMINRESVAVSGTKVASPLGSTSYVLSVGNTTVSWATVNVTLPSTVHIKGNTDEWKALLVQAVGTPNERVVLDPGVDLDMSGYQNVYVRQGVTLTSERPLILERTAFALDVSPFRLTVPGRDARTLGPRIYTKTRPRPLFNIECADPAGVWADNVKFEGFRLQGPHQETMEGDDNLETGIAISSCVGVEVSNMELSGFSGAAISVSDPRFRQVGPGQVRVRDNYIHNNQHVGGWGYGVAVGANAWVTIERNVFDFNRHAITANGKDGTSYVADHNLVLKGGGVHDKWYSQYTHLFDVHGDANCDYLPGDWFQHIWNCGSAGTYFEMTNNAFQYTNDYAIKLRGVPRSSARIQDNVFAHGDLGDAIETFSNEHVTKTPNKAGVDPFGKYGVCDFDGDGTDDLFLATGRSWWFSSAGKLQWTWLSANTEKLDQVGLGDFDGDHRCDVLAVNASTGGMELSKGGTGAWTALGYSAPFSELRFGDFDGDKIVDVFRRAPDGQWWAVSPGHWGWRALQSSSIALADLKFGDFDGDGLTDVMKRNGSGYQISTGGTSAWKPWGSNTDDFASFLVADVDGSPGADLLRWVPESLVAGRWEISSQGRNPFVTFARMGLGHGLVGRFKGLPKSDLLGIDFTRMGRIASYGASTFTAWSLYAF